MCLYLRVLSCLVTWLASQALARDFDFRIDNSLPNVFIYSHPLTAPLHVKLVSSNPVRLYISFCSTNRGHLINSDRVFDVNFTSFRLYKYLEKTKCTNKDPFYSGSEPLSIYVTVQKIASTSKAFGRLTLETVGDDSQKFSFEFNRLQNSRNDSFSTVANTSSAPEILFSTKSRTLLRGEIFSRKIYLETVSDIGLQLTVQKGEVTLRIFNELMNDENGTTYGEGFWERSFDAEAIFGESIFSAFKNFSGNSSIIFNSTEIITLWLRGENDSNLFDVTVYRFGAADQTIVPELNLFQRLGYWIYVIGVICILVILIMLALLSLLLIHCCCPSVAVHDGFEVIGAYTTRSSQKVENTSLPLQTYA